MWPQAPFHPSCLHAPQLVVTACPWRALGCCVATQSPIFVLLLMLPSPLGMPLSYCFSPCLHSISRTSLNTTSRKPSLMSPISPGISEQIHSVIIVCLHFFLHYTVRTPRIGLSPCIFSHWHGTLKKHWLNREWVVVVHEHPRALVLTVLLAWSMWIIDIQLSPFSDRRS